MVDDEPMEIESVGQRLRAAREAKGMSLEDVAAATRIPTRHLASLEESDWGKLPAATYSVGFAKNYATAVGLDKAEISEQLRGEMGSELPAHYATQPESFEPVDSNRSMPKGIVIGAIVALVVIVVLLGWLSKRNAASDDSLPVAAGTDVAMAPPVETPAPAAQGPVVITANDAVWIDVRDGATVLKQGELASGQSFEVPATATRPTLTTGKPEALRISIGTADAPQVGPSGQRVSSVSLIAADLMRGPVAGTASTPVATPAPPQTTPARTASKPAAVRRPSARATSTAPAPSAPSPVPAPAPATTNAN